MFSSLICLSKYKHLSVLLSESALIAGLQATLDGKASPSTGQKRIQVSLDNNKSKQKPNYSMMLMGFIAGLRGPGSGPYCRTLQAFYKQQSLEEMHKLFKSVRAQLYLIK